MSKPQVVIDSNLMIYASDDALGVAAAFIRTTDPVFSAITRIEVLGYHKLSDDNRVSFERSFAAATIVPIENAIVDQAIALRQMKRMSLGDAVIAATALEYGLALATRNAADFRWIPGLHVIDPFSPTTN